MNSNHCGMVINIENRNHMCQILDWRKSAIIYVSDHMWKIFYWLLDFLKNFLEYHCFRKLTKISCKSQLITGHFTVIFQDFFCISKVSFVIYSGSLSLAFYGRNTSYTLTSECFLSRIRENELRLRDSRFID